MKYHYYGSQCYLYQWVAFELPKICLGIVVGELLWECCKHVVRHCCCHCSSVGGVVQQLPKTYYLSLLPVLVLLLQNCF